jgi:prepilin-type processing-associated H-X9-DG protein
VALVKISQSAGRLKGIGFAITGLVLPLVILPFMMAIMVPALARTRQIAIRMVCGTNMHNLGRAMLIYANDHDGFPTTSKWCDLLIEHAEVDPSLFRCKGAFEGPCNYAMNTNLENFDMANAPPDMVFLFETKPGWNQAGGPEMLTTDNHQGEGCNILFADNHVEFVKTRDLDKLKW